MKPKPTSLSDDRSVCTLTPGFVAGGGRSGKVRVSLTERAAVQASFQIRPRRLTGADQTKTKRDQENDLDAFVDSSLFNKGLE